MDIRIRFITMAIVLATSVSAFAQTMSNPDISVIADTRAVYRTDETAKGLGVRSTRFEFAESELNIGAYLNPYMRADVAFGLHGVEGPFEIGEASVKILRGLPFSLQIEAGQYFLDFGRINQQHSHQWAWIERPLMHRTMLGEEGLRTLGANLSTLQAIGDNALTISVNAFNGDAFAAHDHDHSEETQTEDVTNEIAGAPIMYAGSISLFREMSDATNMDIGGSWIAGEYDAVENLNLLMGTANVKVKWRPDKYRAVDWVIETAFSDRDVVLEPEDSTGSETIDKVQATGVFSALQVRFRRLWDVGGFVDYTQDASIDGMETSAFGFFAGFMPAEETARISIVVRRETSDLVDFDDTSATIQFLWALGPHRPHQF